MAGIADPSRFAASLTGAGWSIVGLAAYRDHHRYTARDLAAVADRAHAAGVNAVLTTEKDAVRLLPLRPLPLPMASVPLEVTIEPLEIGAGRTSSAPPFRDWLMKKLGLDRGRA